MKLSEALAAHRAGRFQEAEKTYTEILRSNPRHFYSMHMLGVVYLQTGRHERGVELIRTAITIDGGVAEAHSHLGNGLRDLKRVNDALTSYDRAIALRPDFADAFYNRGVVLWELRRPEDAIASYDRAIALKPGYAMALNSRADALQSLRRFKEALADYDSVIALMPSAETYVKRANTLVELKNFDEALTSYNLAINLKPDFASAYCNRGIALFELGCLAEALASYDKSIELEGDHAETFNNRGNALRELRRYDDAIVSYDKAIVIRPHYFDALLNRGNILRKIGEPEQALASYNAALKLNSAHAGAYNNRGVALWDLKRSTEALESYQKSIELDPSGAEPYNNRGSLLLDLNRHTEALVNFDKAIELRPDYLDAHLNRGTAFAMMREFEQSFAVFDRLFDLAPDMAAVEGLRLNAKMQNCDWHEIESEADHLIQSVRHRAAITDPFFFLAVPSTAADQLQCSEAWVVKYFPPVRQQLPRKRQADSRIHVAYVSADFRHHPIAYLTAGLFECHDRSRYQISAISLGANEQSEIRERLKSSFEEFVDASSLSDQQIADLIQSRRVDILVDLMGFTTNARTAIFSRRSATIQVNYLGYPGTMGAPYIDYIIADRVVIPEQQRACYSENVVFMPNSYFASDARRPISEVTFTRVELGLPGSAFVFCCFNKAYKINEVIFDCWMRILKRIPNSVLWLLDNGATPNSNLRKQAELRGVASGRLVFAPVMPPADHLARHRVADLCLDTLPYNAHTTASDALWAGLPLITCLGETFAGRVAASLLYALKMPELVTSTLRAFENLAVELALHPDMLASIRVRLAKNRLTTPLFDTATFTKAIETAFSEMVARSAAGLEPSDIIVTSDRPGATAN